MILVMILMMVFEKLTSIIMVVMKIRFTFIEIKNDYFHFSEMTKYKMNNRIFIYLLIFCNN